MFLNIWDIDSDHHFIFTLRPFQGWELTITSKLGSEGADNSHLHFFVFYHLLLFQINFNTLNH